MAIYASGEEAMPERGREKGERANFRPFLCVVVVVLLLLLLRAKKRTVFLSSLSSPSLLSLLSSPSLLSFSPSHLLSSEPPLPLPLTCQLLEDRDEHRNRRLGRVRPCEQPPEPAGAGLLGPLGRGDDLSHLSSRLLFRSLVVPSPGAPQHFQRVVGKAPRVQRDGRVRQHRRGGEQQDRGNAGAGQRQPPPEREAENGQVHQLRDEDADRGRELEEDVEGAADVRRGHLGEVERDGLRWFRCVFVF